MTTNRIATLLVAVLLMGVAFLLPKMTNEQPVGVVMELPAQVGAWKGEDGKITDKEIGTLGKETDFARKIYRNERGDVLDVTIVLAGRDMNTSIHRPERCSEAQGFSLHASTGVPLEVPQRGRTEVTRLLLAGLLKDDAGEPIKDSQGRQIPCKRLTYYWFTGATQITPSHFGRTRLDITDRLLSGYNQRWAYFLVGATVTQGLYQNGRSEAETSEMIEDFIKGLIPPTHLPSVKFGS
jgi:hypothetical protein